MFYEDRKTTAANKDAPVLDTSDEMKKKIDEVLLQNLSVTPSAMFQLMKNHFDAKHGARKGLNDKKPFHMQRVCARR